MNGKWLSVYFSIFLYGGLGYNLIEILWRGQSHWSMTITGGIAFAFLYWLNGRMENESLAFRCLMSAIVITCFEFVSGCIFNLFFNMNIWDYSALPFHFLGQICLWYSFLWFLLSVPVLIVIGSMQKYIFPKK